MRLNVGIGPLRVIHIFVDDDEAVDVFIHNKDNYIDIYNNEKDGHEVIINEYKVKILDDMETIDADIIVMLQSYEDDKIVELVRRGENIAEGPQSADNSSG